jgi:hypothetical protein
MGKNGKIEWFGMLAFYFRMVREDSFCFPLKFEGQVFMFFVESMVSIKSSVARIASIFSSSDSINLPWREREEYPIEEK